MGNRHPVMIFVEATVSRLCALTLSLLFAAQAFAQDAQRPALAVEELECRGNEATSCDYILGYLYLSPGDPVDEDEILNARLRLSSQPAFRSVNIYLEKGSSRDRVRVIVEVAETDPYAREWLAGTSWRADSLSQLLTGRLTHQNLAGTGKLLDLSGVAYVPLHNRVHKEYSARAQYVDPHLLGAKRNYLIAGISGGTNEFESREDIRVEWEALGADITFGRRLWDFSYFSVLFRYNTHADVQVFLPRADGGVDRIDAVSGKHALIASYGWNSEDDPYFPTRGSRAVLRRTWAQNAEPDWDGGFRKTWTTAGATSWYVKALEQPGSEYRGTLGEEMEATVGFARPIAASESGEIRRGRWYVEAGYSSSNTVFNNDVTHIREYGLKVGVRLDTRSFGVVELYVLGTGAEITSGGAQ